MEERPGAGNARFFTHTGPHTISAIAAAIGCEAPGREILVFGLASLEDAGPDQISFLGTSRHGGLLERTNAGAVIVQAQYQLFPAPEQQPPDEQDPASEQDPSRRSPDVP